VRKRILSTVLCWLAVVLILRVLGTILSSYPDYFPPDFDSLFLQGREATFTGVYRVAFYLHIVSGPVVLLNGLVLLSEHVRRTCRGVHRWLGRVQATAVLVVLLPSGAMMAKHSFGGWGGGFSFLLLSVATAGCTVLGIANAVRGRYASHRRWMLRSYVLICSAVALRLISGAASAVGVEDPETAYIVAAWVSWLVPLSIFEILSSLTRRASEETT